MQRSTPLTRNTGPASCARNFDGTVSRCFASSVCSKLPLKAKAHGVRESGGVESIRGGGVGGAPPPRTGCSSWKVPHFAPLCNTIVFIRPTNAGSGPIADAFRLEMREFGGGSLASLPPHGSARSRAHGRAAREIADRFLGSRRADPPCARGLRGHERGADEQEDRRHEQQRDDELDLRRGAGGALRVPAGRPGASLGGLRLERRAERRAMPRRPSEDG